MLLSFTSLIFKDVKPLRLTPRYLYIDLVRGLAALIVLIHHYVFLSTIPFGPVIDTQYPYPDLPWYSFLGPIYNHGGYAVSIFWIISGFVFSSVYSERPSTASSFFVNRLARLYPLHILTLIIVATFQIVAIRRYGHPLIYGNIDLEHFLTHIFFASNWFRSQGFSFNGPIWSISVEIIIYAVFWMVHRRLFSYGVLFPALFTVAFLIISQVSELLQVGLCGFAFFFGCGIYVLHSNLLGKRWLSLFAVGLLYFLVLVSIPFARPPVVRFVIFPALAGATILILANFDISWPAKGMAARVIGFVGDNTYGTYLWHIPFQLFLMLSFGSNEYFGIYVLTPWFLSAYLIAVCFIARVSFLYFEMPARRLVRRCRR